MQSTVTEDPKLLEELNSMGAEDLLRWAWTNYGERAGIITSFQNTGVVTIDMASRVTPDLRVLTVDTLRLHPETYALMDELEARYGITIERFKPEPGKTLHDFLKRDQTWTRKSPAVAGAEMQG